MKLDWCVMSIAYWSLGRFWSTMAIYFLNGFLFCRRLIRERLPLIQEESGKCGELSWVGNISQMFWCNAKHCHWCEMKCWGATNLLPSKGGFWTDRSQTGHRTHSKHVVRAGNSISECLWPSLSISQSPIQHFVLAIPCCTFYSATTLFW